MPHSRGMSLLLAWLIVAARPVMALAAAVPTASPDSSILVIAGPEETGTRLIVTGRILTRDGARGAPRARVGVYHTDHSGEYGVHPVRRSFPPNRDARLSGWLVTDSAGRFEVRTIRPGGYPGGGTPAHVHFIVGGHGNYELRFADDPLIRRGGASPAEGSRLQVRPVQTDARGTQHVSVDWRLP